jgi:hypothetical protein
MQNAPATIDRARLHADLMTIGTAILDRVLPEPQRTFLAVTKGVDVSGSIRAICDELASLPDDDLDLILRVVRWEAHALLGATSDPLRVDERTRRALRSAIDVLTKLV